MVASAVRRRAVWPLAKGRRAALVALILLCLGLLAFAAQRLLVLEQQMRIAATENMVWIVGQTQADALRLKLALGADGASDTVPVRFDLLVSRLNLLNDGPQLRYLADAGLDEPLIGIRERLLAQDPLAGGDRAVLTTLTDDLVGLLGRTASRVMAHEWTIQSERLDRQRLMHRVALAAVLCAMLAGVGLALVLLDRERRLMRVEVDRVQAARLEQDLRDERAASERYRTFAGVVAHQFRTPLAVIDSAMHRLTRPGQTPTTDMVLERARQVRDAVRRLTNLTDTVLLMARLDRSAVVPSSAANDLHEVAMLAFDDLCATGLGSGALSRVRLHRPDRQVTAFCDAELTAQVLLNLMSNALGYSPAETVVDVRFTTSGNRSACLVEDRGPGLAPHEMARVFESFVRGPAHHDRPGSGLGLPLARHLARLQGGDVDLEAREGGGLVARLWLPSGTGMG